MNAQQLLCLYDRMADAPGAIDRLRRFVLDLAVRGALVEQDSTDQPASALLERVAAEKARLEEAGELRRPRQPTSEGQVQAGPFEIPSSWRWCRLGTIGAIVGGGTPRAAVAENFAEPGTGIPWLTPADLGGYSRRHIKRGARDLSRLGLESSSATLMPKGTVLFTSRAPIGYVAIADNAIATNQGFKSIVPYISELSDYVALAMRAFAPGIDAKAPGTTFREVSGKIVAGISFPLPPLAEQHRIVAKVDQLMELCARLDEAGAARERRRSMLTSKTLRRLSVPDTDVTKFRAHARFAINSLSHLVARPDQLKILHKTLLDLAIRGKLSERHPCDTPPNVTLSAIRIERDATVKALRLRPLKQTPRISDDDEPFVIPNSWTWVRLGDLALFTQYGTSSKANVSGSGMPVLAMGNIQDGRVVGSSEKRLDMDSEELPRLLLKRFDLLYNRTNSAELVGKTGIYLDGDDCATFASYLIRIRLSIRYTSPLFVNLAMNAPTFRESQIVPHIKKQTGQANVSGSVLRDMLIPLPPHEEQDRIVAKVDKLTTICRKLEAELRNSDAARSTLIDCVLDHVRCGLEVKRSHAPK